MANKNQPLKIITRKTKTMIIITTKLNLNAYGYIYNYIGNYIVTFTIAVKAVGCTLSEKIEKYPLASG